MILLHFFSFILVVSVLGQQKYDYAAHQLEIYAENETCPYDILTTSYGVPITEEVAVNSLNTDLLRNIYFMDTAQNVIRERIPARVVHSKGTGAFGYLEITNDVSRYCRAKVFSKVGAKIPLVARLSLALTEKGGSDTQRETRGLSVKLYTTGGNLDIVCTSSPVYAYKDPVLFPGFFHALLRNPATGLRDPNMIWDFIKLRPESLFFFLFVLSDLGIPDGYIHAAFFNIHTMQVANKKGESNFVRFHFLPDAGIKNLTTQEAIKLSGIDPDYATRGLYNAIAEGNFPSWTLYGQFLTYEQVRTAKFNPFDVTCLLPIKDYPLTEIAKLVLNRNPDNQFAQIEQLAFNPGNLPDGFVGGPGKLFESRQFVYRDAPVYRLGPNFNNIEVNCPLYRANTYNRDGYAPVGNNGGGAPNYFPNSFGGYSPIRIPNTPNLFDTCEISEPENFEQARDFYENELTDDGRRRLVQNIVMFSADTAERLQIDILALLKKVHPKLAIDVALELQAYQVRRNVDN